MCCWPPVASTLLSHARACLFMWHKSGTVDYALAPANLPDFSHQTKAPSGPQDLRASRVTFNSLQSDKQMLSHRAKTTFNEPTFLRSQHPLVPLIKIREISATVEPYLRFIKTSGLKLPLLINEAKVRYHLRLPARSNLGQDRLPIDTMIDANSQGLALRLEAVSAKVTPNAHANRNRVASECARCTIARPAG
jgi:hypothetical protein